jgi:hypothetical protein
VSNSPINDTWEFETPDFTNFKQWERARVKDLKVGDYLASEWQGKHADSHGGGYISQVQSIAATGSGSGTILVKAAYSSRPSSRNSTRAIQWSSIDGSSCYKKYAPVAKKPVVPDPPAVVEVTKPTEKAASPGTLFDTAPLYTMPKDDNEGIVEQLSKIAATLDRLVGVMCTSAEHFSDQVSTIEKQVTILTTKVGETAVHLESIDAGIGTLSAAWSIK